MTWIFQVNTADAVRTLKPRPGQVALNSGILGRKYTPIVANLRHNAAGDSDRRNNVIQHAIGSANYLNMVVGNTHHKFQVQNNAWKVLGPNSLGAVFSTARRGALSIFQIRLPSLWVSLGLRNNWNWFTQSQRNEVVAGKPYWAIRAIYARQLQDILMANGKSASASHYRFVAESRKMGQLSALQMSNYDYAQRAYHYRLADKVQATLRDIVAKSGDLVNYFNIVIANHLNPRIAGASTVGELYGKFSEWYQSFVANFANIRNAYWQLGALANRAAGVSVDKNQAAHQMWVTKDGTVVDGQAANFGSTGAVRLSIPSETTRTAFNGTTGHVLNGRTYNTFGEAVFAGFMTLLGEGKNTVVLFETKLHQIKAAADAAARQLMINNVLNLVLGIVGVVGSGFANVGNFMSWATTAAAANRNPSADNIWKLDSENAKLTSALTGTGAGLASTGQAVAALQHNGGARGTGYKSFSEFFYNWQYAGGYSKFVNSLDMTQAQKNEVGTAADQFYKASASMIMAAGLYEQQLWGGHFEHYTAGDKHRWLDGSATPVTAGVSNGSYFLYQERRTWEQHYWAGNKVRETQRVNNIYYI